MSSTRYTLDEAARIRALAECARYGHSWDIVAALGSGPLKIVCNMCGWLGVVTMGERPERPTGTPDTDATREA